MSIEKHIQNMLRVKPSKLSPMAGRLLIAEPFMFDMYFRRTVVLLIDHSEEGSFGVVLNKPTFIKIKDVVDSFPDVDYPLYSGLTCRHQQCIFFTSFIENHIGWISRKG